MKSLRSFFLLLGSSHGMGLIEVLMVGAMIAGGSMIGIKMMEDMKGRQQHSSMVDVQKRLAYYHDDLLKTLVVKDFTVVANPDIVSHANGSSPVTAGERRCMQMRGQGNAILLADTAVVYNPVTAPCVAGGKYFDERGRDTCKGVACTAANARFHVHGLWEAGTGIDYKVGIVVRHLVRAGEKLLPLKDINTIDTSLTGSASSQIWSLDSGTQSISQIPASPNFGMGVNLGTEASEASLHVVGDFYVSSNPSGSPGNKMKVSSASGEVGISTTGLLEYKLDTSSNLMTGWRVVMGLDPGAFWIGARGTANETERVAFASTGVNGTGYANGLHFRTGDKTAFTIGNDYFRYYWGRTLRFLDAGNNWYGRIFYTGFTNGNLVIESIGGGSTFINWYGGTYTYIGDGNNTWGPIYASLFNPASDERLKKDVEPIRSSLEIINKLRGVRFRFRSTGKESLGFIAQEVEPVLPEIVRNSKHPDGPLFKSLNYESFTAILTEGVKDFLNILKLREEAQEKIREESQQLQTRLERAVREQKEIRAAWCKRASTEAICQ